MIGMGDLAAAILLSSFGAMAWRRSRAVGGKIWAFRIVPWGLVVLRCFELEPKMALGVIGMSFVAYACVAYKCDWRWAMPKNWLIRNTWWLMRVLACYVLALVVCSVSAGIVREIVRWSPLAIEADWPWRGGTISGELPFSVEYKRAKTFCAEYDKRLRFKSGKIVGLLIDTCGYGPFRVYKMKDGLYCLEDGYGIADNSRFLRVNVAHETVELKYGNGWFPIPEKGYVRGWGGVVDDLKHFSFDMYSGGDLNGKGWHVTVEGTPVGQSLEGMGLIGEIDTRGRFRNLR